MGETVSNLINRGGIWSYFGGPKGPQEFSPNINLSQDFLKDYQPQQTSIPEYYRRNPSGYDFDLWKQAYAKGTGMTDATTTSPEGQLQTSFGSWDPSRTYGAYMGNVGTSSSRPFFEGWSDPTARSNLETSMAAYGAPGHMKPYYSKGGRVSLSNGGLANILGV